ncbi:hypothetical protein PAMP_012009 [Pampus punctatissimus]
MASHVKLRKERVGVVDYDTQIKEVRCQLVDQLKVLDLQLEQKSQQLQDMTDYLRRRGEIENEYSRSLEKLAEKFTSRIKRKEPSSHSVAQVWLALLTQTRQESKDHNRLSEKCSNLFIQPLMHCLEYTQRLAKKSKDICTQLQDGLLKVTTELQTAWRTYYQYHSDYMSAEVKLKEAEKQEEKQKQPAKKLERLIEKCADVGYHLSVGRVMQAFLSTRWQAQQNLSTGLQQVQGSVSELDQCQDRDTLLQDHNNSFCMPLRFPYQPHDGDQVSMVSAESEMRCELETRFRQIQTRLKTVTQETVEATKSMSAAQSTLLEGISLHHEGIFRVPGSQTVVNNLRDAFERGDDPLTEQRYDLDSVAGVLKLYFRGLEGPLFPIDSTSQLLEYAQIKNAAERAAQFKTVICSFPEPVIVVMRYLFAFLHHVSQYSDENMMQPYNLAVCFGPSLVRGAQDDAAVTLQPQINALVKNFILQHESIFPSQSEVQGPVYEKCMTLEQDDCEPINDEGDGDAEFSHSKDADQSISLFAAPPQKKAERPRSNSSGAIDQNRLISGPAGGAIISAGKLMLQIPIGPEGRPRRIQSPGYVRRDVQKHSSSEDIVQVDKEVCYQMNSVFKELLSRQTQQDLSSTASSPSAQAPQRKGKRDGQRGRGVGLFKAADPLE